MKEKTLRHYEQTSRDLRYNEEYNDIGKLNLAAYLGERAHFMLQFIRELQAEIKDLREGGIELDSTLEKEDADKPRLYLFWTLNTKGNVSLRAICTTSSRANA